MHCTALHCTAKHVLTVTVRTVKSCTYRIIELDLDLEWTSTGPRLLCYILRSSLPTQGPLSTLPHHIQEVPTLHTSPTLPTLPYLPGFKAHTTYNPFQVSPQNSSSISILPHQTNLLLRPSTLFLRLCFNPRRTFLVHCVEVRVAFTPTYLLLPLSALSLLHHPGHTCLDLTVVPK